MQVLWLVSLHHGLYICFRYGLNFYKKLCSISTESIAEDLALHTASQAAPHVVLTNSASIAV